MRGAIWRHAAIRPHPAGQPGSGSQRAGCGARWRPGAAPQGSRPRCQPRGARMGRRRSRLYQGRPRGMRGAKGPSRDRSREGRRRQPGHPEPAGPMGQCRGMWRVAARRNAEADQPAPHARPAADVADGPRTGRSRGLSARKRRNPPPAAGAAGALHHRGGVGLPQGCSMPCLQPLRRARRRRIARNLRTRCRLLSVAQAGRGRSLHPAAGLPVGSGPATLGGVAPMTEAVRGMRAVRAPAPWLLGASGCWWLAAAAGARRPSRRARPAQPEPGAGRDPAGGAARRDAAAGGSRPRPARPGWWSNCRMRPGPARAGWPAPAWWPRRGARAAAPARP